VHSAEVFRSVDAAGNVSYSDRPVGANSETVFIATPGVATPPPVSTLQPQAGTEPTVEEGELQREPREATPEERAAERTANCGIARERLDRYLISRRLYRTAPDGERAYLSDAEIDEAKARAAADVEKWCD
jgi:hypothetical protein